MAKQVSVSRLLSKAFKVEFTLVSVVNSHKSVLISAVTAGGGFEKDTVQLAEDMLDETFPSGRQSS